MSSRTDTPDVSPLSRPELQARAMGFMFLAATVVGFFAGFFPSEHIRAPEVFGYSTIFFIPVVSLLTTIACFTTGARWNRWMWLLMLLGTNVLVGNAIYNAGTVPSGAEVFLMWTLLFAGFFMSRTDAVVVGLQACIVMAIVIAIGPATVK
ncbi:MAG: hypothetical protein JHC95_20275, partial [Solirubrobacteraceae bacterium]|nr:hypothetical protein [Solirubrobacteraceae bacterium]